MRRINLIRSDVLVHAAIRYPLTDLMPLKRNGDRDLGSFNDDQLVDFTRKFIEGEGISGRKELAKADRSLYCALWKRKLLDEVGFADKLRSWKSVSDEEMAGIARELIGETKIGRRYELKKADKGLYRALMRRKLLGFVGLERRMQRDWIAMSDEELVGFAKRFIREKGIGGKMELLNADRGLYTALAGRGLFEMVELRGKLRNWSSMSGDGLVSFARKFSEERGIEGRSELEEADKGLYNALRRRKLLGALGLGMGQRDWASMNDEEIVGVAGDFIKRNKIEGRKELEKADRGLYSMLCRRKLVDAVFSQVKTEGIHESIGQIIEGLKEFDSN